MDILDKARRLESTLARSLDDAARRLAKSGARQPLEIVHAIVEAVEGRLEPAGRGGRVFPFNTITVYVATPTRELQSRFEAVFAAKPSLHARIVDRLGSAGTAPEDLTVTTSFVPKPEATWTSPDFHLEFDRVEHPAPPLAADTGPQEQLKLVVVAGSAQKPSYAFALDRINLGRCTEVRDSRHRLIRTNHVAFADNAGGLNHTVSRRHAHIDYAANTHVYRLCDDGSAHGTSVVRNGKTIPVPVGARGIRLQPGDEIVLGEARLRVRFG
jgi:hypothetical protein